MDQNKIQIHHKPQKEAPPLESMIWHFDFIASTNGIPKDSKNEDNIKQYEK